MTFIKRLRAYMIVFFLISFAGSVSQVAEAGSRVGNGGDPIDAFLSQVRMHLVQTLQHIVDNYPYNRDSLVRGCTGVNQTQKNYCADVIIGLAYNIILCNVDHPRTQIWAETASDDNDHFMVDYAQGRRKVSAVTKEGCAEPIRFDYDAIRDLPEYKLLPLMAHEFGHKVKYGVSYIDDIEPIFGYDSGQELLNAVGDSIYRYGASHGNPLIISPDAILLRTYKDTFSCEIKLGSRETMRFTSFSRRRAYPDGSYESITDAVSLYGLNINQYLPADPSDPDFIVERLYLKMRVRGGKNSAGVCLANYGSTDFALLRDDGDMANGVGSHYYTWDAMCQPETREIDPVRYLSSNQVELEIKCSYDGQHVL